MADAIRGTKVQLPLFVSEKSTPLPPPTIGIHSRRYLGAKTRLLDFLDEIVQAEVGSLSSFADVFGGTGVVAHHFNRPDVAVFASDILLSNVVSMRCFLQTQGLNEARIRERLEVLEALEPEGENYVSEHFGGRFFSEENARRIGAIRQTIADWRTQNVVTEEEEAILLTSLLYGLDRCANTCGHYDAYRVQLDQTQRLTLALPEIDVRANVGNRVFHGDANQLVDTLDVDVLYLDPPYNSRQYSDTYHLLENLIQWQKPPVFGKARKMNRATLKSPYCSPRTAAASFAALVARARCRTILLSYNNMGLKGDSRSNACIPDEAIMAALESRGRVTVHERPFQFFTTGLREIADHTERVFVCRVG